MRLCFVGTAGHVNVVTDALPHPSWEAVAVCPAWPDEDISWLVSRLREKGQEVSLFNDYCRMLDEARPDAVVICGYNGQHGSMCIEAASRGIHIMCEKPLCTSMEEYEELTKALVRTGAKIAGMHTYRFHDVFAGAYEAIKGGEIGVVRLLDARKSYKMGRRPWHFTKRDTFGGILSWVGIHAIDWLRWLSGEEFVSVFAQQSALHNDDHGEMETTGVACFAMTGGVTAVMTCDYYRPGEAHTHGDDRVRIVGTKGVLEIMDGQAILLSGEGTGAAVGAESGDVTTDAKAEIAAFGPSKGGRVITPVSTVDALTDFTRLIRGERSVLLTQDDSLQATRAALLVTESADTSKLVCF